MNYATAKQLKEMGLTQKRHDHAKYYLNENTIAYFEDIKNAFQDRAWQEGNEEVADWMENFTYHPELVDFIGVEQYRLTLDTAAYHFLDGKLASQQETIQRTEEAVKETVPLADKKAMVAEMSIEGIEKIKQAIHASQKV